MNEERKIPQLFREPIKQQPWYLQIKDIITRRKRNIDKLSIAEILQMYRDRKFICDTCDKEFNGALDFSLEMHICHMINPDVVWSCDDCIMEDYEKGRVLATTDTDFLNRYREWKKKVYQESIDHHVKYKHVIEEKIEKK